jgi:hypothetical protein
LLPSKLTGALGAALATGAVVLLCGLVINGPEYVHRFLFFSYLASGIALVIGFAATWFKSLGHAWSAPAFAVVWSLLSSAIYAAIPRPTGDLVRWEFHLQWYVSLCVFAATFAGLLPQQMSRVLDDWAN